MTSQDKIKYLKRYTKADKEINRLISELSVWRSKAVNVSPTISDMPKNNGGENRMESAIIRIIEIENELNDRIDALVDMRIGRD